MSESEPTFSVLLVDDNEVVQTACRHHLEQNGYRVLEAPDGEEALRVIGSETVDLVLLDVMMPGLNGFEVLEALRQKHSPEELPVVMATAKDQNADVVKAFRLGANDYVTKPLDFPVLLVRIRAQLRSRLAASGERARRRRAMDLRIEPGAVLDGKYRLDSALGQGAYGIVYRATHLALDRPVAVKLLDSEAGARRSVVERFQREGVSACRIDHPNAVTVLDSSVTPIGVPYLVMELLEGVNLEDELKRWGRLSPRRTAEILFPICDVLSEAHAMGIIHRDVKPQNVFLHRTRQGEEVVKVLDFGIAKLVGDPVAEEELAPEEGLLGTPLYMAPERFAQEPYDGRADVYSLGVMLYEMLAGQHPFGEPSGGPLGVILKHLNEAPTPLLTLCPELPEALGEVVLQALEKEAANRPSADELARGFAAALDLEPPPPLRPTD